MTRRICVLAAAIIVAACEGPAPMELPDPAFSASTITLNELVPANVTVFIPCALGGAGETVQLEGTLHILIHETVDAAGGIHLKTHFQPQRLTGVGLVSGTRYQGTGVTQDQLNLPAGGGLTLTLVNNFRIIGQGPGNNFLLHNNVHITVTPNGALTAAVDNFSSVCK